MENDQVKPRLSISFSGGRSSAVMTRLCLLEFANTHTIVVTFANTGCEHEATLEFVRDCDLHWGFNTVWLEAVIGGKGVGPRAKIVDFATASRDGKPFEDAIKKHGIFNPANPNCTNRLKIEVMESYLKSIGWDRGSYSTAIGIRADEMDRVSPRASQMRVIYPLVNAGIGKKQVAAMMAQAAFDLRLPGDHYGNCVWCWKKSMRKLLTVAKHTPEAFDFPARMERDHGHVNTDRMEAGEFGSTRTFFRHGKSSQDILETAHNSTFREYEETRQLTFGFWDEAWDELDIGGGCGDSCEAFADENTERVLPIVSPST